MKIRTPVTDILDKLRNEREAMVEQDRQREWKMYEQKNRNSPEKVEKIYGGKMSQEEIDRKKIKLMFKKDDHLHKYCKPR